MRHVLLLLICLATPTVSGLVHDLVSNLKSLRICSGIQQIENASTITLEHDVEVMVDELLHVWADRVVINKDEQTLHAYASTNSKLVIESEYFLLFAQSLHLDLPKKTGSAEQVRVHLDGKFFSAERAEKIDDDTWQLHDVVFTACDAACPHWSFRTPQVELRKYLVRISHPTFNIGSCPILWLPLLYMPVMGQSKSGFLMPRFSVDRQYGFGISQEYYWDIFHNVLDTIIGAHWRQKRGVALFDTVRHASNPNSFSMVDLLYARDWSCCSQEVPFLSRNRYWIKGHNVLQLGAEDLRVHSLLHLDIATDNQIAYDYFNKVGKIEDYYWNTYRLRWDDEHNVVNFMMNHERVLRDRYMCCNNQLVCRNDKTILVHFPQVSFDRSFWHINPLANVRAWGYADHVSLKHSVCDTCCSGQTARFDLHVPMTKTVPVAGSRLRFNLEPVFQFRSKIMGKRPPGHKQVIEGSFPLEGAYRLFAQCGIDLDLPQLVGRDDEGRFFHYVQPRFSWQYVPTITQGHWLHADEHDCIFAQQSLWATVENRWYIDRLYAACVVSGGYDFAPESRWFPLRRATQHSHWLPLVVDLTMQYDFCNIRLAQQYSVQDGGLLQSELMLNTQFEAFSLRAGWVYQSECLQKTRALLADISSMLNFESVVNLGSAWQVSYAGQFTLKRSSGSCFFPPVDILLQRFRVDYKGHCWGIAVGFEEKRYAIRGCVDTDQVYFFSLRLQSLGVFAKHFKQTPVILSESSGLTRHGE